MQTRNIEWEKAYREENREKLKASCKKWRRENPEKKKANNDKWNALRKFPANLDAKKRRIKKLTTQIAYMTKLLKTEKDLLKKLERNV